MTSSVAPRKGAAQRDVHVVVCASNTAEPGGCDVTVPGASDEKLINAAISGCSAANGCKITLRNGVYNIGSPIIIDRSYVTLEGESWPFWGAYRRAWSGPSKPVSEVGTQGAQVRASASGFNLIEIQHRNLPDNGERRHRGIRVANLYVVGKDYSNNCIDSAAGNLMDDSGSFENLTLTRCAWGLNISVDNGYIQGNNLQDLAQGGASIAGANSRFINNIVWDVGGRGLLTSVHGMVVTGNTFGDTASHSVEAQGPGRAVITGNGFGPTASSEQASSIYLACSGCVVSGNYFDATTGVYRSEPRKAPVIKVGNALATRNVIVGNSFVPAGNEAAGLYAIDVTASNGNVVVGNGIGQGFNNLSATTIRPGVGNLVALNSGDISGSAFGQQVLTFQPGPLTGIPRTRGGFSKLTQRSVIDHIEVSAMVFECSVSPTVTLYGCGDSATCANPVEMGSATVTAAGKVSDGLVTHAVVGAGDYVAWGFSAGTCSALNVAASAQIHVE